MLPLSLFASPTRRAALEAMVLTGAVLAGYVYFTPSLSTSGETLTIEESMTLRARTENAGHVGDEDEWSPSWRSG